MGTDIKDYIYDFIFRLKQPYGIADRCLKCPMLLTEKVSYEYDEWDSICMYEKDIYDVEYCYIPMFLLKLLMPIYKNKFEYKKLHEYDGIYEWMVNQDKSKLKSKT